MADGASQEHTGSDPVCSCSNPTQWLEATCAVHGAEVARQLEAMANPPVEVLAASPPAPPVEETTPADVRRGALVNLTPAAEAAARLDAWGNTRKEIAEQVGVTVQTVSVWRRSPEYIERRRIEIEAVLSDTKQRLAKDQQGAFEARERARERLVELLDASDPDGRPYVSVRMEAAKALLADKAATSEYGDGKTSVNVGVQVGAVLHVYDDAAHEVAPPVRPAVVEQVIEAEYEEVEEHG